MPTSVSPPAMSPTTTRRPLARGAYRTRCQRIYHGCTLCRPRRVVRRVDRRGRLDLDKTIVAIHSSMKLVLGRRCRDEYLRDSLVSSLLRPVSHYHTSEYDIISLVCFCVLYTPAQHTNRPIHPVHILCLPQGTLRSVSSKRSESPDACCPRPSCSRGNPLAPRLRVVVFN